MTYNELINITQNRLNQYDINKKIDIVEDMAQLIVSYAISNKININDFDFKNFYMVLEYDWSKT